jgi:hypothetical protein
MTFRTRKEEFAAATAAPVSATAQSDDPTAHPRDGPQPDDEDLLVGYPRMSEFAIAEGYPVSTSTMQKRGSPAIGTGPELIGYFGQLPASTKGRMRKWLRAGLRPDRPASKRWSRQLETTSQ